MKLWLVRGFRAVGEHWPEGAEAPKELHEPQEYWISKMIEVPALPPVGTKIVPEPFDSEFPDTALEYYIEELSFWEEYGLFVATCETIDVEFNEVTPEQIRNTTFTWKLIEPVSRAYEKLGWRVGCPWRDPTSPPPLTT